MPQLELEIKFYLGQTAQNIIEVGKRLIQAKSLVNHGHWQHWLELNFQLSHSTAKNFMACAERFGESQSIGFLKSTQMIQLLALPSAEETEKFIAEKAAEGKAVAEMTIKELREGQEIGKLVLLAEARLGELFNQMPKAKENQYTKSATSLREEKAPDESEPAVDAEPPQKPKPKLEIAADMGFNKNQVAQFQTLANNPEIVNQTIAEAKENAPKRKITFKED